MTFCVVDKDRTYRGGVIFPGIGILCRSTFERTSKLPRIEIKKIDKVVQTNTVSSMQSGLYHGYNVLIDGIIEMIIDEMGFEEKSTKIISTGGFSSLLTHESKYDIIIDKYLTLDGLRMIYDMNRDKIFGN